MYSKKIAADLSRFLHPIANQVNSWLGLPTMEMFNTRVEEQTSQLRKATDRQKAIYRVVSKIRASLDLDMVFRTTTKETCKLLGVERVAVYRFFENWGGEFIHNFEFAEMEWDRVDPLGQNTVWNDTYLQEHQGGRYRANEAFCVADVHEAGLSPCHVEILDQFQIQAYATVPIFVGSKLWGVLGAYQHSQTRNWTSSEIDFLKQISIHLGIAVKQAELIAQTEQKARDLQEANNQQSILLNVITKIRESLDLEVLFQSTTREARLALKVDRVGVFQFEADSNYCYGEFVRVRDYYFGEQYASHYENGRMQVFGDIRNAELEDCHISVLEQFQIKAQIIVPLMKGKMLWGLLCVHQCDRPREWNDTDIQFVRQLATQFSVALEQADLLAQTRSQADQLSERLEEAMKELQQSQMQILQTEKMASLGQLVAGIAHEINNPVNFIHGNLSHV
jgi:GAF domain-containing protein